MKKNKLRSVLFFLLIAGSLPVLAGDGIGIVTADSHLSIRQHLGLAIGGGAFEAEALHHTAHYSVVSAGGLELEAEGSMHSGRDKTALALGDSQLEQKLKSLAAEKVEAECQSCKVTVECKWMSPLVLGASLETITGVYFDNPGMPAGYATAKVAFDDAMPSANAIVQFYISVRQKVPVATSNIERGAPVNAADFRWQWKNISRLNRQPIASEAYFKDKTAARMIRKGHIFYPSDLLGAMSIRPGDRVIMQYGGEGVQLQIACIARETKGVGQKVRLYSKETGRRYLAKIVGKNEIIWIKTL